MDGAGVVHGRDMGSANGCVDDGGAAVGYGMRVVGNVAVLMD